MNFRKEFFRVSLSEIREEVDKLKQGEDFTVKIWTDKAVAQEYKDSLEIESDPQKKEKWLARQKALTDRQLKLDLLRLPLVQEAPGGEDNDLDTCLNRHLINKESAPPGSGFSQLPHPRLPTLD